MKKLFTILILGLLTLAGYGQSGVLRGPGGLWIGNATTLTPVFKIGVTPITTTAAQFNYINTLTGNVKVSLDAINTDLGDYVIGVALADSSDGVLGKKRYATSDDLIIAMKDSSRTHRVVVRNVKVSHTGDINATTVYTGTIPANSIGVDGSFHIIALWSYTSSTDYKTLSIKFNGTEIGKQSVNTTAMIDNRCYWTISNRHSLSSQVSYGSINAGTGFNLQSSTAIATYTFNTGADITITVIVTNVAAGDTSSLEAFEIIAVN